MNNYKHFSIEQVCDRFSSGIGISAAEIKDKEGYPVFGGNGIRGYSSHYNFDGECAIIGRQGAYCGNVRYFHGKAYMTEHAIVACSNNKNCTGYLAYLLSMMNLAQFQGQSAQPGLSVKTLQKIMIPVPNKQIQERVFFFLNSIDSKIENNNKIAAELEAMAKTIYDYWFLQFDFPDENGRPYKSSGGKMVWNEELKREIPKGWEAKTLDFISKIETSSVSPENGLLYHHYSIPAFDEKHVPVTEDGRKIDSGKYKVPKYSILVSKLNPQFKRIWLVGDVSDNSICSTEFMPFVSTNQAIEFLYETVNSNAFYTYMVNSSSSSTGSRKRMQPELCGAFTIVYPKEDDCVIKRFCDTINAMLLKISEIYKENQELTSLRDFLLPLLMNGQVTIKNAIPTEARTTADSLSYGMQLVLAALQQSDGYLPLNTLADMFAILGSSKEMQKMLPESDEKTAWSKNLPNLAINDTLLVQTIDYLIEWGLLGLRTVNGVRELLLIGNWPIDKVEDPWIEMDAMLAKQAIQNWDERLRVKNPLVLRFREILESKQYIAA